MAAIHVCSFLLLLVCLCRTQASPLQQSATEESGFAERSSYLDEDIDGNNASGLIQLLARIMQQNKEKTSQESPSSTSEYSTKKKREYLISLLHKISMLETRLEPSGDVLNQLTKRHYDEDERNEGVNPPLDEFCRMMGISCR